MASFLNAISDFVKSIFELFASIFTTAFDVINTFFAAIASLFSGFIQLIAHTFKGVFNVVGETGKFLIGNGLIIIVVALAAVGYLSYQRQQGKAVVVNGKKLN